MSVAPLGKELCCRARALGYLLVGRLAAGGGGALELTAEGVSSITRLQGLLKPRGGGASALL